MDLDTLFGQYETLPPIGQAATLLAASIVVAMAVAVVFHRIVFRLTRNTAASWDDKIAQHLRGPVVVSVVAVGLVYGVRPLDLEDPAPVWIGGAVITAVSLYWGLALSRLIADLLGGLADDMARLPYITPRTLPIFDIGARTLIYGGCTYFVLLAWDVDVTGWLASAGIIGVAVGFASQDTLSNLIAGVFILADAPYKLGDFLVLETGERGEVVDIGIRTTRLMTRDDVEIIVPNKVMANALIINQSGGPHEAFRVRIAVGVAYGSDIDRVHDTLMAIATDADGVEADPAPRVRFRAFGDSSLDHDLLVWVARPSLRGQVSHRLHTAIYKRFNELKIEIPFPQRDVHLIKPERTDP